MATYTHSWDRSQRDLSRRFLTGLVTALSFTLVAYEWRSGTHVSFLKTTLADEEHVVEDLPVNFTIKRDLIPSDSKVRTTASTGRIVASEPVAVPTLSPQANIQPDPTGGPEPLVTGPERLPDEVVDPGPRLWDGVEQRPYFATCLEEDRRDLDACTEARIDAHLQKHFRVPREMRREEFTVITMEVTASGAIGMLICAPEPSADVKAEIERVIRSLPTFMPGTQNGLAVPVIHQLPFRVRRI